MADYSPDNEIQGDDPQQRQRRAMLFTTALLLRHQMSIRFAVTYKADRTLEKYLNQQDDTYGIPANLIVQVNEQLIDPSYQGYIASAMDGHEYDTVRTDENSPATTKALQELIAKAKATITENPEYAFSDNVKAALSEAKRHSVNTYLTIQQFVATQIGDFRIKQTEDITNHKIDSEKVDQFHELLKPGDILIERRDWYSSNAFLPGYWPHGALYIGTPEELVENDLLDDVVKELTAMAKEEKDLETAETQSVDGLTHADRMFALVEDLKKGGNEKLNSRQIMEAISEGVYHNTVDHSVGEASSVFALSPHVKPHERAKAIAAAYFYEGREYDFNFDFETRTHLYARKSFIVVMVAMQAMRLFGFRSSLSWDARRFLPMNWLVILFNKFVMEKRSTIWLLGWILTALITRRHWRSTRVIIRAKLLKDSPKHSIVPASLSSWNTNATAFSLW